MTGGSGGNLDIDLSRQWNRHPLTIAPPSTPPSRKLAAGGSGGVLLNNATGTSINKFLPSSQTVPQIHKQQYHKRTPTTPLLFTSNPGGGVGANGTNSHPIFTGISGSVTDINRFSTGAASSNSGSGSLLNGSPRVLPPPLSPFNSHNASRLRKKDGLHLSFPVSNTSNVHGTPSRRNVTTSDSTYSSYLSRELERQKRENQLRQNPTSKQRAKSVESERLLDRYCSSGSGSSGSGLKIHVAPGTGAGPASGTSAGHAQYNGNDAYTTGVAVNNNRSGERSSDDFATNSSSNSTSLNVLKIAGCKYMTKKSDITFEETLGAGVCGTVYSCTHKVTGVKMAVKVMTVTGNKHSDQQMFRDIQVNTLQHNCPYIVTSFGCLLTEQSIYICMEQMLTCLEKLLKSGACFEENVLGKIAYATLEALDYLKTKQSLIHRDIKPSNILVSHNGVFKLCDFGICGKLVNSNAATRSVGCVAYLAPERVEPNATYDIRADVWALGITIMELALQKYPYPKFETCTSEFEVLVMIKDEEAPRLGSPFSKPLRDFTERCVQKNRDSRPKHKELLKHPFVQKSQLSDFDVSTWVRKYISFSTECDSRSISSLTSEDSITPRKISSPALSSR